MFPFLILEFKLVTYICMQKGCGRITYCVLFFEQVRAKQSSNCVANLGSLIQLLKNFQGSSFPLGNVLSDKTNSIMYNVWWTSIYSLFLHYINHGREKANGPQNLSWACIIQDVVLNPTCNINTCLKQGVCTYIPEGQPGALGAGHWRQ
jgi:hypothetical protein